MQLLSVLAEPTRLVLPARPNRLEQAPERLPVTRLAEMAKLVDDDVLEHFVGPEEEPPREGEIAAARARPPARARVADSDRLVLVAEPPGLAPHDISYATARLA